MRTSLAIRGRSTPVVHVLQKEDYKNRVNQYSEKLETLSIQEKCYWCQDSSRILKSRLKARLEKMGMVLKSEIDVDSGNEVREKGHKSSEDSCKKD